MVIKKKEPVALARVQITESNVYFERNQLEFYEYDRK